MPPIDRDDEARSRPQLLAELRADPATRYLPVHRGKAPITDAGALALTDGETGATGVQVYLGRVRGRPLVASVLGDAEAKTIEPATWVGLREADLDDDERALLAEAIGMANWHDTHRFCPRCGSPTEVERSGWVRRCANGHENFPRTDPAVIVRVVDDAGRILLGSNVAWESNRWSLLAGFVEPGESFEDAVVREVHEESGVTVREPRYLGSQPWPVPASVMIGFEALAADPEEAVADGQEIVAVRWFTREELWAERESILLPRPAAIAHRIIRGWYGGPLAEPPR